MTRVPPEPEGAVDIIRFDYDGNLPRVAVIYAELSGDPDEPRTNVIRLTLLTERRP